MIVKDCIINTVNKTVKKDKLLIPAEELISSLDSPEQKHFPTEMSATKPPFQHPMADVRGEGLKGGGGAKRCTRGGFAIGQCN